MKNRYYLLPLLVFGALFLTLTGCHEYEVQYEGPYDDATNPGPPPASYEMVYARGHEIFMLDSSLTLRKRLGNFGPVKLISINYKHNRIAYKLAGENIEIIDTTGASVAQVPESENVDWFDWHQNGETLYLLDNMKIKFYGPPIDVPVTYLGLYFPSFTQEKSIPAAAVTPNGWVIFNYRYYENNLNYRSKIRVIRNVSPPTFYELNLSGAATVKFIRLVENGNLALIGFENSGGSTVNLLNVSTGQNNAISSRQLAAIRPDAGNVALWGNGRIFSFNDTSLGVDVGSVPVTSMDW
jgi:hypothetical protein